MPNAAIYARGFDGHRNSSGLRSQVRVGGRQSLGPCANKTMGGHYASTKIIDDAQAV